jgi:hypothetical protein
LTGPRDGPLEHLSLNWASVCQDFGVARFWLPVSQAFIAKLAMLCQKDKLPNIYILRACAGAMEFPKKHANHCQRATST